ncbi:hypothetical protein MBLNU459_g0836t1 [Dothideomycetes sp. NU459]
MMNLPQSQSRTRLVSPLSMESNDSNFLGQYQNMGSDPYSAASGRAAVAQRSPPLSQHASGSTDNSLSSRPSNRSPSASNGHMSSSSSLARSSDGAGFYSPSKTEFGQPQQQQQKPRHEDALQEHYNMLKSYLAPYLRGEAGANRPTRARDKLLRLSPTQFHELSTDVYDELLRREDDRRRPGGVVPPFLPPKNSFHPKRNQARQKLSTLPPERFRQLATDVYFELERRIPRFAGGERTHSPSGSVASSFRGQSRQGPPSGPPNGLPRQNSQPNGFRGGPPPPGLRPNGLGPPGPGPAPGYQPYASQDDVPPGLDARSRSGSSAGSFGRPLPKTFQSNTMVPNKSTMVEDDDSDEDEDGFGLEKVVSGLSKRSTDRSLGSEKDRETIKEYGIQVAELQEKVTDLEERLRATEAEVQSSKQRESDHEREKDEWSQARADMGTRLAESQSALDGLHAELEKSHQDRSQGEIDLRAQTERTVSDLQLELDEMRRENETLRAQASEAQTSADSEELRQQHDDLQNQLAKQRELTDEVRNNAAQFLQEMRLLSEQSELALEKEEQLRSQISSLETESEEWKSRYTRAKTQLRSLRASSVGLPSQQDSSSAFSARQELLSDKGLVHDMDVTAYQISIDELLHAARESPAETLMQKAKDVVGAVRNMTAGVEDDSSMLATPESAASPQASSSGSTSTSSLKALVSRNANYLVSAARTHATSSGLAPVSLVDCAANNLTASVVAFLKTAGIRPSTSAEMQHETNGDRVSVAEIAPLSTNKAAAPVLKAPVPPQKGWFSMLKGDRDSSAHSDDDDDEYDYS